MQRSYDVLIAGAGVSGFAAALGAADAGARVLLIDRMPAPGGTAVYAMTPVLSGWPSPGHGGGAADRLCAWLAERGRLAWREGKAVTEEAVLQNAMASLLHDAGVETRFGAGLLRAEVRDRRIVAVTVGRSGEEATFAPRYCVDATGDAELAVLCGAEVSVPPVELSMTKTLMFKMAPVRNFDKPLLKARFREKKFPVVIQNEFMGTRLPLRGAAGGCILSVAFPSEEDNFCVHAVVGQNSDIFPAVACQFFTATRACAGRTDLNRYLDYDKERNDRNEPAVFHLLRPVCLSICLAFPRTMRPSSDEAKSGNSSLRTSTQEAGLRRSVWLSNDRLCTGC